MTTSDELDELFNMAINAKEIAVKTADEALEFADNSEIAAEANKLLDRYRVKFREDLHRLILKERRKARVEELYRWAEFFKDPTMNAMIPSERLEKRVDELMAEIEGSNHADS